MNIILIPNRTEKLWIDGLTSTGLLLSSLGTLWRDSLECTGKEGGPHSLCLASIEGVLKGGFCFIIVLYGGADIYNERHFGSGRSMEPAFENFGQVVFSASFGHATKTFHQNHDGSVYVATLLLLRITAFRLFVPLISSKVDNPEF